MKRLSIMVLASLVLTGCNNMTTASEVDAAFQLCSGFGGVRSFEVTAYYQDGTKNVEATCKDGTWAGRRIKEVMLAPPSALEIKEST